MTIITPLNIFVLIVIIFVLWYSIIIGNIIPIYYSTWRGWYIYEKNLWNKVEETCSNRNNNILKRYYTKNKKVIKRYYTKSSYSFVKEKISTVFKIGEQFVPFSKQLYESIGQNFHHFFADTITKNNVSKELKIQSKLTNSQVEKSINLEGQNVVPYDHRGFVKGVKINEDETVDLTYFDTITTKANHKINLELSNEEKFLLGFEKGEPVFIIPTQSMPGNKLIQIGEVSISNKGFVTTSIIKTKKIQLDENNVLFLPKNFSKELKERAEGFMETIGWKGYEFFYKEANIYGVHKDDIYRVGGIIMHVNMAKAKPVILRDYAQISKEIANNPEVNKFINIDPKTKEMYEQNYKILKDIKKD